MKKGITISILIACCFCFAINGSAAPAAIIKTAVSKQVSIKKAFSLTKENSRQTGQEFDGWHLPLHSVYSSTSCFISDEAVFSSLRSCVLKEMLQPVEAERVLKDHLLHLFPSHYFW